MIAIVLVLEDSRRTGVHMHRLGHREGLHHGAIRSDVAPQDREPAVGGERIVARPDDLVCGDLEIPEIAEPLAHEELAVLDLLEVLTQGLAGDGDAVEVQHVAQLQHHRRHAAGVPEVLDRVPAGRLHVGEHRDLAMDAIEVVDRDLHGDTSEHTPA
jgi:hypothetical protein